MSADARNVLRKFLAEKDANPDLRHGYPTDAELREVLALADQQAAPIQMLLFCPKCSAQHVDAPQPEKDWTNPPHRSHECQSCGHVWRPSDVATTGVASIATTGSRDGSAVPVSQQAARTVDENAVKRVFAVPYDGCDDAGRQLYTITDDPIPMADHWFLFESPPPDHRDATIAERDAEIATLKKRIEFLAKYLQGSAYDMKDGAAELCALTDERDVARARLAVFERVRAEGATPMMVEAATRANCAPENDGMRFSVRVAAMIKGALDELAEMMNVARGEGGAS